MQFEISKKTVLLMIVLLSACNPTKPIITELSSTPTTYDETIRINNCGNKADSTQTASRSFSTKIAGTGTLKAGYDKIIEGSVSATYEQFRNISKTQSLTAAPNTNMEFVLRWSDDVRAGNVTIDGENASYTVNIPISVDQISSKDLECPTTDSNVDSSSDVDISSLTGNWSGTIKSLDGSFSTEVNLSFQSSCKINEVCGTYDAYQLPCSGTLTLVKVTGDSFVFSETKMGGESWCGVCYEYIQKLEGNSISYACTGSGLPEDIQSRGVFYKQ